MRYQNSTFISGPMSNVDLFTINCILIVAVITLLMLTKDKVLLDELAGVLSSDRGILKIIAFGSRVRGDCSGDSDFDILVVVDKKGRKVRDAILNVIYSHELEKSLSISPIILSLYELDFNKRLGSPFIKSVEEEGIVVYDAERRREEDALKVSS
jgi:predicted nucleotidyltransferase